MGAHFNGYIAAALLATASALALAQTTPPAPGQPEPKQTAPAPEMHRMQGKHHGNHDCCGPNSSSGWSMMDKKERAEYREHVRSSKTYQECRGYVDEHHTKMVERAKDKGLAAPNTPQRDACAWLKK